MVMPAWKRATFEVVEAEFGLELLILLFDRPPLMRESDELLQRRGPRQVDEVVLGARRRPEILSHKSQTSGARRWWRHSVAGVTRIAINRAVHGRCVPLRHDTRRQRDAGTARANARTLIAVVVGSRSISCDRGRPRGPSGGRCTAGVPRNTVNWRETPSAYGNRH